MKRIETLTTVKFFAAALVAAFLSAGVASAQTGHGTFRLSQPVQWGKVLLPAGEYEFALNSASMTGLVVVHSRDQKTSGFVMPVEIARLDTEAPSALIIEIRGNERTVRSLRLAERRLVLNFGPEKGRGRKAIEEARATEEIPVLAGK